MVDLDVELVEQKDGRLGRQKVHDPRSRSFPVQIEVDPDRWRNKAVRVWDPRRNPNQCHGECTGCANAMMLNSVGNRVKGQVLGMDYAHKVYSIATSIDPWQGSWPPEDTGSSGLAAAKAAQRLGMGGEYRHIFGGADEVVQLIQEGRAVSVGTWWYQAMFNPDRNNVILPNGQRVGGHQYLARGYNKKRDLVLIRCWWGGYRDVWISRMGLDGLLRDGGDAHIQNRSA